MAYDGTIFAGTLGQVNVGVAGAISVLNPLLLELDLALFGSLGLGALQFSLQAQLQALIQMQLDLGLALTGAFGIEIILAAQIALSLPSLDLAASFSASAALAASISLQLGGIEAFVAAALALKIPATTLAAQLQASLGLGPLFVLAWENITLAGASAGISADFNSPGGLVFDSNVITPLQSTYGVVLVTATPSVWVGLQGLLLTS